MKRLILLLTLLLFAVPLIAQVPTPTTAPNIIDSTGTSGSWWQAIDFGTVAARTVTFQNTGATNSLTAALRADDTVSTRTRYQKAISPGTLITLMTTQRYVYVISTDTSTTTTYTVSNVLILNSQDTETSLDSIEVTLDRIGAQLPAAKPSTFADSLVRSLTGAITYTVGDELTDTSGTIRTWTSATLANGGRATLHSVRVIGDSILTGLTLRIWTLRRTTPVVADNGVFTFTGNPDAYFAPAQVTLIGSAGSTFSVGSTEFLGIPVQSASDSRNIPFRVEVLTTTTVSLGGKFRIWAYFIYD